MPNYENFFAFSYWQYEVIRHLFSFTAAVFAASLLYFLLQQGRASERYRLVGVISCVVMVSATLELFLLWLMWNRAFQFDAEIMSYTRAADQIFANGYRYANWMIDVPMLLTQFIIALGLTGAALFSQWWKLALAGVSMVVLGYVGQYWEPQAAGFLPGSPWGFWVFGFLGWLPLFYILWALRPLVAEGRARMRADAARLTGVAWTLLLVTWVIYGLAYLVPGIPGINQSSTWVVVRQAGYTFADVTSKAVFGIMLGFVVRWQSEAEAAAAREPRRAAA
jgi:hypothetical protein